MATKNQLKGTPTRTKAVTKKPANTLTNTSGIQAQLNAIEAQPYTPVSYGSVVNPSIRSSEDLARMYGITYDYNTIKSMLDNSVNAQYDTLYKEQQNTENNFSSQLGSSQASLMDTLRAQQAQAVMSGASKGAQAANQLSAMLGVSQQSTDAITDMAEARGLLASQRAAAQAQTATQALTQSNNAANQLAELSKALQSNEIQQQAAQLSYNANVNTTNEDYAKALTAAREDLLASYYTNQSNQKVADINGDAMVNAYLNYGLNAAKQNGSSGGGSYARSTGYTSGGSGSSGGSASRTTAPTKKTTTNSAASTLANYQNGSPLSTKGYLTATDPSGYQALKDQLTKATTTNGSPVKITKPTIDTTKPTMPKIATPKKTTTPAKNIITDTVKKNSATNKAIVDKIIKKK